MLCNRYAPIAAFAECVEGMQIGQFLDAPIAFLRALTEFGVVIGEAAELNRRVTKADLDVLSDAERHEAKYWKPKRVGDIIFNWWD